MSRSRSFAGAAVLASVLLACAGEPAEPVALDLAADLPAAEVRKEVGGIDFGTAGSRAHLAGGWYANERGEWGGGTFVWSRGPVSVLEIDLMTPRDLRAVLRCMPLELAGAPQQAVAVELNGRRLTELALDPGFQDYAVTLPGDSQVPGRNRLAFHYRWTAPAGGRRLAVAWDSLRFRPAPQAAADEPRVEGEGEERSLFVPFGVEVDSYLDLTGAGTFAHRGLAVRGRSGGRLVLAVQQEGEEERVLELGEEDGAVEVPLPGTGRRLLRLALRAVPVDPAAGGGGVLLEAPVVRGRRAADLLAALPPANPPLAGQPPIVLYVAGNLRADRLGAYGSRRGLTPHLDAFARGAWVFEDAVAQSSATRPALASLFTGLGPLAHGVHTARQDLPAEADTLTERLRQAGYIAAGLSAGTEEKAGGLDQGFEPFVLVDEPAAAVDRAVLWLGSYGQRGPFFLYLHAAAEEISAVGGPAAFAARYEAEVAAADRDFGRLVAALRSTGLYDRALIVVLAAHGEALGEQGRLGHGGNLRREALDIPLLVKLPGAGPGRRIRLPAQQIDVLPTVLGRLGLRQPDDDLPGLDLAQLAVSETSGVPGTWAALALRPRFSHVKVNGQDVVSVIADGWKRIEPLGRRFGTSPELYHRARDRGETRDLLALLPVRAGYLASLVRGEVERNRRPLDLEERDRHLRRRIEEALGEPK